MGRLLTDTDHERIVRAIGEAEATTSGEIYCVVARRTSDYRFVPLFWGAFAALLVPALALAAGIEPHRWPLVGLDWWTGEATEAELAALVRNGIAALVAVQIIVFLLAASASWPMGLRLRATPRAVRQDRVHRAAVDQFLARGMQRTRERTGVLIFVALGERQVEVVADEGIYGKVDPRVWDDAVGALLEAAREDRLADGFVEAVTLCGSVLAVHFPPRQDDLDELPNHVIEL
jgi:putative membrane protein